MWCLQAFHPKIIFRNKLRSQQCDLFEHCKTPGGTIINVLHSNFIAGMMNQNQVKKMRAFVVPVQMGIRNFKLLGEHNCFVFL